MVDTTLINSSGIIAEIIGFSLMLYAVGTMIQRGGFDIGMNKGKLMTLKYPWIHFIGIGLVIAGLFGQLTSSLLS
jgi:hypothetical protein